MICLFRPNVTRFLSYLLWIVVLISTPLALTASEAVIFQDGFGASSRGELHRNTVSDAPPVGLGYKTNAPEGFLLKDWIVSDIEADGPRKSFWVIPKRSNGTIDDFAEQAGRSRDSIAFANVPLPREATHFVVEFRQWVNDNDYIGFVLNASKPAHDHDGVEFGYERQTPGTDETVPHIYYRGVFGRGRIDERAASRRWATHRIEVRGQHVRWSQDGEVLLAGSVATLRSGGYFGIRQRYERGTRYDDVRITVLSSSEAVHRPKSSELHHVASVAGATWNAVDERPEVAGWLTVALLPNSQTGSPHLQWWSGLPKEAPARLRFSTALAIDEKRTVEAVFAESNQSAGTIEVSPGSAFQNCELKLSTEEARRAVEEGVKLRLLDGTEPLWILWRHEKPNPRAIELLPQLLQE